MSDKDMLEAFGALLDAKLEPIKAEQAAMKAELVNVNKRLDVLQSDFDESKEGSAEVRAGVNKLLGWAEEVGGEVKVPLFRKLD